MPEPSYKEGDWFVVPLREDGFATGLIARTQPRAAGVIIGYFFGPRRPEQPTVDDVSGLTAGDALMVRRFGHLGFTQMKWPILGQRGDWNRDEWPMPVFGRFEELTGRAFKVFYDDLDPNHLLKEEKVMAADLEGLPRDGLLGAGAVERVLTGRLR